jgi:hypothetical protein
MPGLEGKFFPCSKQHDARENKAIDKCLCPTSYMTTCYKSVMKNVFFKCISNLILIENLKFFKAVESLSLIGTKNEIGPRSGLRFNLKLEILELRSLFWRRVGSGRVGILLTLGRIRLKICNPFTPLIGTRHFFGALRSWQ